MQKIIAISTCFLQKINILSNKPSKTIQKFRCTLTNLNTADEVTRIDGTFAISFYIISGLKCASRSAKAKSSRPPTLWCRFPKTGSWNPSDEDAAVVVSRWAATGRLSGRVGWRTLRWSAWRAGTAISKSGPVSPRQVIFRKKILKKKT